MPRKKKTVESKQKASTIIKYTGKVTAEVRKKDSTVNKKLLFNAGTIKLFEFIASCLANNYTDAAPKHPHFLNLFDLDNPETIDIDTDLNPSNAVNIVSIIQATAPVFDKVFEEGTSNVIGYFTRFKFEIPLVNIRGNISDVSVLTLNAANEDIPSAFVVLQEPLVSAALVDDINDYILSINWEMQFTNK